MAADSGAEAHGDGRTRHPRSRLFTVRLWTEEAAGGIEYRGSVRDVTAGAYRDFREWAELTAFMVEQTEEGLAMRRKQGGIA